MIKQSCLLFCLLLASSVSLEPIPQLVKEDYNVDDSSIYLGNLHEGCQHLGHDWYRNGDSCFKWSGNDKQNWFQSEFICRSFGGHLASIHGEAQNTMANVVAQCTQDAWLGRVNVIPGSRSSKDSYRWWDGSAEGNFSVHSTSSSSSYDCVYLRSERWYNGPCEWTKPYLCKVKAVDKTEEKSDKTNSWPFCPHGWHQYGPHCFYVSTEKTNYFHAQLACRDLDASVASIRTHEEQMYLNMLLGCENRYWIGLERAEPCTDGDASRCWEWSDREPLSFANWANGNPSSNKDYECSFNKGHWYSISCTYAKYPYICRKMGSYK